jgi:uncharacterized protein
MSAVLARPSGHTDKAAVLCHGFMGFKDSWTNRSLTRVLIEHGVAAFRFDLFGHGESEGPLEKLTLSIAIAQTDAALATVRARGFERVGLVGISFGGLVATHVAAHSPWLAALALRCPVADFPELLRLQFGQRAIEIWRLFGLVVDLRGGTRLIPVDYGFYEDCCRYDSYEAAARIHVPTIVVHGECDELVPQHQIYRLHDAIAADKELQMIAGANHRFTTPTHFDNMTTSSQRGWYDSCQRASPPDHIPIH